MHSVNSTIMLFAEVIEEPEKVGRPERTPHGFSIIPIDILISPSARENNRGKEWTLEVVAK